MGPRFQVGVGVTFLVVGIGMTIHGATVAAGIGVRDGRFEAKECRTSASRAGSQTCEGRVDDDGRGRDARYEKATPPWIDEGDSFDVIWSDDDEPLDVLSADDRVANPLVVPLAVVVFAGAVMLPVRDLWPTPLQRPLVWLTSLATAAWLACVVASLT